MIPADGRRAVLGLALATLAVGPARPEDDAAKAPPQPNDRFVFLTGPKKGEVVSLDSLVVGGPQLQVFPVSPEGTVRKETLLNLVILTRFDPAELSEETGRAPPRAWSPRFSRGTTAARRTLFPVHPHREIQDHMRTGVLSAAVTAVLLAASLRRQHRCRQAAPTPQSKMPPRTPRHEAPYSGK